MALRLTLTKLDDYKLQELYDTSIAAYVSRNPDGEVTITKESSKAHVSYTLESLLRGPCAGYKGNALDERIRVVMAQFLRDEQVKQGMGNDETDTQEVPQLGDEDDEVLDALLDAGEEDD